MADGIRKNISANRESGSSRVSETARACGGPSEQSVAAAAMDMSPTPSKVEGIGGATGGDMDWSLGTSGEDSSDCSNLSGARLLPRVGQVGDGLHGEACRNVETASRRLQTLAKSEARYAPRADYLESIQTQGMTESWRERITAWCVAESVTSQGGHSVTA